MSTETKKDKRLAKEAKAKAIVDAREARIAARIKAAETREVAQNAAREAKIKAAIDAKEAREKAALEAGLTESGMRARRSEVKIKQAGGREITTLISPPAARVLSHAMQRDRAIAASIGQKPPTQREIIERAILYRYKQ